MMADNYAGSQEILYAIEKLSAIENPNERQKLALSALQAKQAEAEREVGATQARYRGFGQGVTFGLRDEAAGVAEGLFGDAPFPEGYAFGRDVSRGKDVLAKQEFPSEFSRGEFAGVGASSVIPFGMAGKAPQGASLFQKAMAGAKAGGLTGFMQEFGRGEGFWDRMEKGGIGALISAPFGAGAYMAPEAFGALGRYVAGGGDALPGFSPRAASKATQAVRQHMSAGGDDISSYLSALGPEGVLADIPGPLQSRAMGLASMPGEGGATVSRIVEQRAREAGPRITRAATRTLGGADDALAARVAQSAHRTDVGSPLYKAALSYQEPMDAAGALQAARDAASRAGPTTRKVVVPYAEALANKGQPLNASQLHGIRSDLSDAAEVARRAGNSKQASALDEVLRAVDGELDKVPGYSEARKVWAESFEVEGALDAGRKALAGGPTSAQSPAAMVADFNAMKPEQQEAFQKGIREYVASVMGTARNDASAAKGLLGKGWNREKLAAIIGQADADELFRVIDAEDVFTKTRTAVTAGSQTAQRQEAAADLADIRAPDTLRRPGPFERTKIGVNEASNAVIDALVSGRTAQANADLGRILSLQGPERDAIALRLSEMATKSPDGPVKEAARKAIAAMMFMAGQGAAQTVRN